MKKLMFIGLLCAAYWYWNNGQLPFDGKNTAAVDAAGNSAVWVFTFEGCGNSCANVVRELRNRNVPFEEKVISPERRDEPNFKIWQGYGTGSR